jgi:hypothetical protein
MSLLGFERDIQVLKKEIKDAFCKVQEESEEHLDAINDNTSEIQNLQETCSELDCKIEKLSERLDEIYLVLEKAGLVQREKFEFITRLVLTKSEEEIFSLMLENEDDLTYIDISHNTGFDQESIKSILSSLVQKGVPIVQKFLNNVAYLNIQKEFKDAKESNKIPVIVK